MAISRERKITQRQINAIETKKNISKCAMELFEEHGFYNIRVEDIVEKAGIAKGSFYTHFKSKDQVVVEYYKNIDNYYEFIFNQFDDNISSYEKLMEILKAGFIYTEKFGKELLSVVLINQISGKEDIPHVANKNRKIYKIIQGVIKAGRINGEFSVKTNDEELTMTILQLYSGIFISWTLLEDYNLTETGINSLKYLMEEIIVTTTV